MTASKGLMLHCGANVVEFDEVKSVKIPEATNSFQPIPHHMLVNMMLEEFAKRDIEVKDSAHCLGKKGGHYFGLFEVLMPNTLGQEGGTHNLVIGLRNSHLKDLLASLIGGGRVFICDNLCLSGEIHLGHKHTLSIIDRLPAMIALGLSALDGLRETQEQRIITYKDHVLTREQIILEAVDMSEKTTIRKGKTIDVPCFTWQQAKRVLAEVKKPSYDEHLDENGNFTAWTLQNAVTEALKLGPNPHTNLLRSGRAFKHLDALTGYVSPQSRVANELKEATVGTDIVIG